MDKIRITASRARDMMTAGRGKDKMFGDTAIAYAREIVLRQHGFEIPDFTTWQMEHGIEWEPTARDIYIESRNVVVELPGSVIDPTDDMVSCTPDGIVDGEGLLEIKCPQWGKHSEYLMSDDCPKEYYPQVQFQMMVMDLGWCDFMTFNPDMPDHLKAKVIRIERDEAYIELMRERVKEFKILIGVIESKIPKI